MVGELGRNALMSVRRILVGVGWEGGKRGVIEIVGAEKVTQERLKGGPEAQAGPMGANGSDMVAQVFVEMGMTLTRFRGTVEVLCIDASEYWILHATVNNDQGV